MTVRLCVIGMMFATIVNAQPVIDENVELMGVAYTMANENAPVHNPFYAKSIREYFDRYKDHNFIKYIKTLTDSLNKNGVDISTWELPSLAVHIDKVDPGTTSIDGWDDRSLLTTRVVSLFHKFQRDTDAPSFFSTQRTYYKEVVDEYRQHNVVIDAKWIQNFTGLNETEEYTPILSLQSGTGAYMRVNFNEPRRNTYSIFTCTFDNHGKPGGLQDPGIPRLMIHETVHQYVNQLVDNHKTELRKDAERLLVNPIVWSRVRETFFNNWEYLMYESVVRAVSIQYISANNLFNTTREQEIAAQEKAGFLWMKDLIAELDKYQSRRPEFKNLESYMPNIISIFRKY